MYAQNDVNRGEFTWKISNFTQLTARELISEAFIVSGCRWRLLVQPKGQDSNHLALYLSVHDSETLPNGWTKFSLSVIDQINNARSIRIVTPPVNIQPARPTDSFDSYFTGLEELINASETNDNSVGSSSCSQNGASGAETPSLEEVEKAMQSLKECLSYLFKLNMKERLSEALSTLSSARTGLTLEQKVAVETFRANFNDFTSDFLTFEQDNAEFELHKLQKDQRLSAMKKCHETYILYKQLMDDLIKEEEEVKSRKDKLLSDWEILLVESEEAKSGYKDEQKKVAETEEKKRIAEERMSRSTPAWSNLKAQFC